MRTVDTVIIGGGQAGLADEPLPHRCADATTSCWSGAGSAERWRSERWDSMRLLSPNWMSRLPGWSYRGPDPDGFMTAGELVDYLQGYATAFGAPVRGAHRRSRR